MTPDESSLSGAICVVCGKDTSGGRGFMTLHLEGRCIALCCPQCQKVYGESPSRYARRLHIEEAVRDIEHKLGSNNPE